MPVDTFRILRRPCLLFLALAWLLLSPACVREIPHPQQLTEDTHRVDPIFRSYYHLLGGVNVLGEAISPLMVHNGISYQYTTAVLMVYDPGAGPEERFHLSPLGRDMGIAQDSVPKPAQSEMYYQSGHIIYPEFWSLYQKMGGMAVIGAPLTEARYNQERKRIEQYFENAGFYLLPEDQSRSVYPLAYGAWKCDVNCRSFPLLNSIIDIPANLAGTETSISPGTGAATNTNSGNPASVSSSAQPETPAKTSAYLPGVFNDRLASSIASPHPQCCSLLLPYIANLNFQPDLFNQAAANLGADLTGVALSGIFQAADGQLEQIYENVVLAYNSSQDGSVQLRPLPVRLQIPASAADQPLQDPTLILTPGDNAKSYNVPAYFLHFIETHGGTVVVGKPMTTLSVLAPGVHWQCFTNLCLEVDDNTTRGMLIRPVAMGYLYKQIFYDKASVKHLNDAQPTIDASQGVVTLLVWQNFSKVASNQQQVIDLLVQRNGAPIKGARATLALNLPDGSQQSFNFPVSGVDGRASLQLPSLAATNSTLVAYQVCVANLSIAPVCVKESYLIWNNP
jgi:hypothetical protein